MRIVVVSGHYPPNFVSGGSLQPQRLAQGLHQRGHDVSVYAGRLDPGRRELEAWDEVDGTGVPVHWIVTTAWDDWGDDRNWHCPEVEADFRRYLAGRRPDVVHLHDLQMLGATLVEAAAEAGARVVVTMHDFWWVCARLFLVNKRMYPCSLVVDAGVCRCQVNRRWLEQRDRRMRATLDHADLILAPSASAARVLAANGLAPDRLRVDENGLPEVDLPPGDLTGAPAAGRRPEHGTVHFVYAGGRHHLKGITVLLQAARAMEDLDGWRLTVYGGRPEPGADPDVDIDGLPVALEPPFPPERRDEVLLHADVMVVPSIMRETHSIVTREALSRGIPVICTNTLGPEEVVRDGDNGLVVPAGDAEALEATLRAVVEDRALLDRLRHGSAQPVAIRSLRDQVDGLERLFADLVGGRGDDRPTPVHAAPAVAAEPVHRGGAGGRPPIRRVVFACGIEGAPLRYRARLAAEGLALLGVESEVHHYRNPVLLRAVERADALYVYRVPATHQVLDLIQRARARGIPVLFDVDDLIFDPSLAEEIPALQILPPEEAEGWLYGVHRYRTTLEHCDGYVGSTPQLVRHARAVTGLPAAQFENGVGLLLARAADRVAGLPRRSGPVRIGYLSGTITHDRDWFYVEPAVVEILERHGDVELWLAGHLPETPALEKYAARVRRVPFMSWLKLPRLLHELDINLAPLEPGSRFNEAKSAIKWLEAGLAATPTIASATEPFRAAVDDGVSGLLADSLDGWTEALDRLVSDARLRRLMGERARREGLLRWSPHLQGRRFLDILEQARDWPPLAAARPASAWVPAVADEPFEPSALEPYSASRLAFVPARVGRHRQQAAWFTIRARTSVAERGVAGTVGRAPRYIGRRLRSRARLLLHQVRSSRPVHLVRYTAASVRDRGLAATVVRAVPFAGRSVAAAGRTTAGAAVRLPGVRHARAATARLRRSLAKNGLAGTVRLGVPVAKHTVVHSANVLRLHLGRVKRGLLGLITRR